MKRLLTTENLTLLAIVLGIVFGLLFPQSALGLELLGDLFLRLLKMLIVPLIFASVFVAIAGLGSLNDLKQLGVRVIGYYMLTTAVAVLTGIVFFLILSPGEAMPLPEAPLPDVTPITLTDFFFNLVPSNIFASLAEGKVLQIILFVILLAIATFYIDHEKRQSLNGFFDAFNDAMLILAGWIIKLTPVGVFALISFVVAKHGGATLLELWRFVAAVVGALVFHGVVTLPLIAWSLGRFHPGHYFLAVREAVLLAFSSASSSATLPVSIRCAEARGGVDKKYAGFVLPLGATVNMDGSAMYESVAVLFIAQLAGMDLSISQMFLIFITATVTSIGVAGIPGVSIIMITMILGMLGLPVEYLALILVTDRILDMFRTAINVWGDLIGARVVQHLTNTLK